MRVLLILLLSPFLSFAQLHHQAVSVGGGTSQKGIFSIGQSSVIGNIKTSGAIVSQGFVNPAKIAYTFENITTNLTVAIYPNPFVEQFTATLDKEYNDIHVIIQNAAGQQVYSKDFSNASQVLVDTPKLSIQTYLITILADKKMFNAKLIKE
jgi:hypothetical protein